MAPILILGAGLSGLCCALSLHERGLPFLLLEASDGVGGRVRTDRVDGFLLDRGFQVYLTAYPEGQDRLDYEALRFRPFYPGALIRAGGKFHRLGDPWRRPADALPILAARVGSLSDKLKIARLRQEVRRDAAEDLFNRPETTSRERLAAYGFGEEIVERFFRPFFGGVFFERELRTSSRQLEFCFRMFASGETVLPAEGMEAIPRQLAARLPEGSIRLHAPIARVRGTEVELQSGEPIHGSAVVVTTEGNTAARLLGLEPPSPARSTVTLYFAAAEPPVRKPILVLDGEGSGPVNHLAVPSQVAPGYAPEGAALVCANVVGEPGLGNEALERAVRAQLSGWFGAAVTDWKLLRTYHIPYALPETAALQPRLRPTSVRPGQYVCGDWRADASINGAMLSGRRAAEAVLAHLAGSAARDERVVLER